LLKIVLERFLERIKMRSAGAAYAATLRTRVSIQKFAVSGLFISIEGNVVGL